MLASQLLFKKNLQLRRNRQGKSALIDETSDALGWDRKHAIKALNGQVALGKQARRGSKPSYGEQERAVIVSIWKSSEQPGSSQDDSATVAGELRGAMRLNAESSRNAGRTGANPPYFARIRK